MNNVSGLCAKLKLQCGAYGVIQRFSKYFGNHFPQNTKGSCYFQFAY